MFTPHLRPTRMQHCGHNTNCKYLKQLQPVQQKGLHSRLLPLQQCVQL
jgi:hypothetical protein